MSIIYDIGYNMVSRTIRLLDDATINQIAAGEVIENPASVVKELVENALDSGSSEICVITKAGGRSLIKVSDDGCGMSPDDLLLAVERHATSKLSRAADLESLCTLGFRGEALPSIAAVSKFSVHSAQEVGGSLLSIEGGKMGGLHPLPRRQGTTIEVKSLFFNTPVRKKFQKSLSWDTAEIHKVLTKFALSFPAVGFSWTCDEQLPLSCPRGEDYHQRIASLLGQEWMSSSVPLEHQKGEFKLVGRICRPSQNRPNRSGQYLFINQRAVISPWVAQQVLESYGTRLSNHRYPLFVLYLTLPPHLIDVNVHPQKREVRLREEERLKPFILQSIHRALENRPEETAGQLPILTKVPFFEPALSRTLGSLEPREVSPANAFQNPYKEQNPDALKGWVLQDERDCLHEPASAYRSTPPQERLLFEEPTVSIVGKVKQYFFAEELHGIRVVDGLRAMERIVFDQLHVEKGKQEVQTLLMPIQLKMTGKDQALLTSHLSALNELGVGIRPFGGDTFLVDAIPAILEPQEIPEWIQIYLEEGRIPHQIGKCLKRGSLSLGGGASLVKKLFQCQNPDYTPAGKRIHHLLDSQQLDKLF